MTNRIKAIPEGYHTLTPHLVVKGASEAIEFYKKAFGAEEIIRLPGPDGNSLMHAAIKDRGLEALPGRRVSGDGQHGASQHRWNARNDSCVRGGCGYRFQ
jgi:hypothetical protein